MAEATQPELLSEVAAEPTAPVEANVAEPSVTANADASSSQQNISSGPDATASPLPLDDSSASNVLSQSALLRQRQHAPDAPGFFPVSLALNQADAIGGVGSSGNLKPTISTAQGTADTAVGGGNDADSDGYGEPSPRVSALNAPDEVEGGATQAVPSVPTPAPFKAGYGEVPFPSGQRPRPSAVPNPWPEGPRDRSILNDPTGASSIKKPVQLKPKHQFDIRVGDPQKVGDPVTAHIVYTVRTRTTATHFRGQVFSVLRRYSDFRWLHAAMVANNPGTFVPPVPEKVKIGRFAPDLVEARRHGLETCINKIAAHPILQMDEDFKLFLESVNFSADVKLRDMRKGPVPTPEQKTYFGWSTSLNAPKFHETDDWFDHQRVYLDGLEHQLKMSVKAFSHLANQRRELAHAVSEYSLMLVNLSGSSLSRSMSTCFAGLGELEKRVQELNDIQSDSDVRVIGSVTYEYERLVGSIRKAFATRVDAWTAWVKADEDTRKIQAKHEKFKKDNRGASGSHIEHKLQASLQEVADAEARSLQMRRDFDAITARCKDEMNRFDREKADDLRKALTKWLDGLIDRQEEIIREWELYAALLTRQTGTNPDPDAPLPPPPSAAPAQPPSEPARTRAAAEKEEAQKEGGAVKDAQQANPSEREPSGDGNAADAADSTAPERSGDEVAADGSERMAPEPLSEGDSTGQAEPAASTSPNSNVDNQVKANTVTESAISSTQAEKTNEYESVDGAVAQSSSSEGEKDNQPTEVKVAELSTSAKEAPADVLRSGVAEEEREIGQAENASSGTAGEEEEEAEEVETDTRADGAQLAEVAEAGEHEVGTLKPDATGEQGPDPEDAGPAAKSSVVEVDEEGGPPLDDAVARSSAGQEEFQKDPNLDEADAQAKGTEKESKEAEGGSLQDIGKDDEQPAQLDDQPEQVQ